MINRESHDWIIQALKDSQSLNAFIKMMGVDPDNVEATLTLFNDGLSGKHDLKGKALNYLANTECITILPVDHALLASAGIDTHFAMAFLHAFGPECETSDWSGDEDYDSVRGLLHLVTGDLDKPVFLANLSLDKAGGLWEMQIKLKLDKHVYWRTDFRGDTGRDEPDILLEYREMPSSLINAIKGKSLKNIIQHPVLDRFSMIFEDVDFEDDDLRLDIISNQAQTASNRLLHEPLAHAPT